MGLAADTPKTDRHVVVVVWDGMRPDFVSEKNNSPRSVKARPRRNAFESPRGVSQRDTGKRYSLVTGVYPGRSSVIADLGPATPV